MVFGHNSREAIRMAETSLNEHRQAVVNRKNDYKTSLLQTTNEIGDLFSLCGYSKCEGSSLIRDAKDRGNVTLESREDVFERAFSIEKVRIIKDKSHKTFSADGAIAAFGAIAGVVFVPIQMWIEHRQHQMERYKLITGEQNSASEVTYESDKIKHANTMKAARHKDEVANKNSLSVNRSNVRRFVKKAPGNPSVLSVIRIVTESNLKDGGVESHGDSYKLSRCQDGTLLISILSTPAALATAATLVTIVQQHPAVVTQQVIGAQQTSAVQQAPAVRQAPAVQGSPATQQQCMHIKSNNNTETCSRIIIENDGNVKLKYLDRIHMEQSYNVLLPVENNRVHFIGGFENYKPNEQKLKWTITDRGQWVNICKCLPVYSEMFRVLDMPYNQRHYDAETVWPAQLVYVIVLLNYLCGDTGAVSISESGIPDISRIKHDSISRMIEQHRGSANAEGNNAMQFDVWTAGRYSLII